MNIKDLGNSLGNSKIINLIFKPAGANMESRFRHWLYPPLRTLRDAGVQPGQTVLEVGCGTGYFTLPAATLIGDQGRLIAIDVTSESHNYYKALILYVCHTKPTIYLDDSIASAQVEVKEPRLPNPSIFHTSSFFGDDKMCFFV